jgi:hypothetical protein
LARDAQATFVFDIDTLNLESGHAQRIAVVSLGDDTRVRVFVR